MFPTLRIDGGCGGSPCSLNGGHRRPGLRAVTFLTMSSKIGPVFKSVVPMDCTLSSHLSIGGGTNVLARRTAKGIPQHERKLHGCSSKYMHSYSIQNLLVIPQPKPPCRRSELAVHLRVATQTNADVAVSVFTSSIFILHLSR